MDEQQLEAGEPRRVVSGVPSAPLLGASASRQAPWPFSRFNHNVVVTWCLVLMGVASGQRVCLGRRVCTWVCVRVKWMGQWMGQRVRAGEPVRY